MIALSNAGWMWEVRQKCLLTDYWQLMIDASDLRGLRVHYMLVVRHYAHTYGTVLPGREFGAPIVLFLMVWYHTIAVYTIKKGKIGAPNSRPGKTVPYMRHQLQEE